MTKIKIQETLNGWLLFFTVLILANAVYYLFFAYDANLKLNRLELLEISVQEKLYGLLIFELWGSLALGLLAIRCFSLLLQKRSIAIRDVKIFLYANLTFWVIEWLWGSSIVGGALGDAQYRIIGSMIFSTVWLLYFSSSTRVKQTLVKP